MAHGRVLFGVVADDRPASGPVDPAAFPAVGRRRLWNGADSMMPAISAEARPFSVSIRRRS